MPYRKVIFANSEYYHVFNRGVAQMPIFTNRSDYKHFTRALLYYQLEGPKPRFSDYFPTSNVVDHSKKIVEIIAYCLMPNHFHFLLRQERDKGIVEFVTKLCNSYAKYFNIKNKRIGSLFQGEFKAVHIENDEQLLHLSRYIHLNPLVGYVTKNLEDYEWSSYLEFLGLEKTNFFLKGDVLGFFKAREDYGKFIMAQEDYGKKLEFIKHNLLD